MQQNVHRFLSGSLKREEYGFTWNGKARETHSKDQECNSNTFGMREAHHQQ